MTMVRCIQITDAGVTSVKSGRANMTRETDTNGEMGEWMKPPILKIGSRHWLKRSNRFFSSDSINQWADAGLLILAAGVRISLESQVIRLAAKSPS